MTRHAYVHLSSRPTSPQRTSLLLMDFPGRLAARGYYVPSMTNNFLHVEASPSQNLACAIHAHGSSSLLSLRSEQVHQYQRSRQRKLYQELRELFHSHAATHPATVKPLKEQLLNFTNISTNPSRIVCYAIVRNMPAHLGHNSFHQLGH